MRQEGKQTQYRDPVIQQAWTNSNNGREFIKFLKNENYQLALGRKRLTIVDHHGKIHNPIRHIEDINTKEFKRKLSDIDLPQLKDAQQLSEAIQKFRQSEYEDYQNDKQTISSKTGQVSFENSALERRLEALQELRSEQNAEVLRLSQSFVEAIENTRKDLKLNDQHATIQTLENKLKQKGLLQTIFGLQRYRRGKLKALQFKFNDACDRFDQTTAEYKREETQALELMRIRHADMRAELLDSFGKASAARHPSLPLEQSPTP